MKLRYFRIAALSLGGFIIAGIAVLHTPPVKRFALAELQRVLAKQGITFHATGFDYNLLSLRARLREVVVTPKADMPPLLKLAAIDLDASLLDLIRGKIVVQNAALTKPEIYLLIDTSGHSNLPVLSSEGSSSSSPSILIEYLSIREASFRYEDRRAGTKLFIPQWQMNVDGHRLTNRHTISAQNLSPVDLTYGGQAYQIDRLQTTLDLGAKDVKILGLNLDALGATLRASGSIENFNAPTLHLQADADAKLDRFAALLKTRVAGEARVQVQAMGPIDQIAVTGQLSGKNLAYQQYKDFNLNSGFSYDGTTKIAGIRALRLASPFGNLSADGKLATEKGQSSLNAKLDSIRLDTLSRLAKSPITLASRATGAITAQWPGLSFERSTTTAQFHLHPTQAPAKNTLPVAGTLDARLRDGNGAIQLQNIDALGTALEGQIQLHQQQLSGSIEISAQNLSQSAAAAATIFASKLPPIAGQAEAKITLAGTLSRPEAQLQLEAAPVTVGTLAIEGAALDANYTADRVEIVSSSVRWKGQSLNATGTIGLDRAAKLNLKLHLDEASISDLLTGIEHRDIPASGRIQLDASITGTTKKPEAQAHLRGKDLVAYSQPFGALTADLTLSPAQLFEAQIALAKAPSETLNAQLSYDLDSDAIRADIQSTPLQLTTLDIPQFGRVTGAISLNAKSTGSSKDPHIEASLDTRNLIAANNKIGALSTSFQYAANDLAATLSAPLQHLNVQGHIATQEPYAFQAQAKAQDTDLNSLPLPADFPATGQFSFALSAKGNASDLRSIDATLLASRLDLRVKDQPISLDSPLDARLAGNLVTIHSAALRAPGATLRLEGSIPVDTTTGISSLHVDARADLAELSKLLHVTASGTASIQGLITGNLQAIDPKLEVKLDQVNYEQLTNANLLATAANGVFKIQSLNATALSAAITGSGDIPFALLPPEVPLVRSTAIAPAALELSVRNLDLSKLPNVPEELKGRVSATLDASATRASLDAVEARLTVNTFNVDYNQVHIEQDGLSSIRYANGVATVEKLAIKGPQTQLALTGSASEKRIDAKLSGSTDISLLTLFSSDLRSRGASSIEITATGTPANPQVSGFFELKDGEIAFPSPRIAAENLNARLDLTNNQLVVSSLKGDLNGGTLSGGGALGWTNGQLSGEGLTLSTRNVYLDFPADLKTVSNLDLKLAPVRDRTLVSGKVSISEGSYTDTLNLEGGIFNVVNRTPELDLTNERSAFLSKLDYNIGVKTVEPIVIDNNLAKVEMEVDARVVGNYYSPGLTGRLQLGEGGELYLNERKYLVDRGIITFVNEQRIEPVFDLSAKTSAAGYDITLGVQGSERERTTTLTSDPPLGEPDIASVLLTGRTLDRLQGDETSIAKEQVLSYLTGRVGNSLGQELQRATGLSQVRIEPGLIANESDPSARLTLGQNLTRQLSLVYSMNLINSGDQLIVGQYDFDKRFRTRALKQSDNSYRFDFSRTQEFGGIAPPPRTSSEREKRTIGKVGLDHDSLFTDEQIRKWLNAREGKRYDFFKIRKGLDKIEKKYAGEGLLESRVRLKRTMHDHIVDVDVEITPGPKVDFIYEGYSPSRSIKNKIRDLWQSGVFDIQRTAEASEQIRKDLLNDRYVEASVDVSVDSSDPDHKRVTFDVQKGTRFDSYKIVFAGATKIEEHELRRIIKEQKLENDAITAPKHIIELVTRYYQEQGYLDAKLAKPELILKDRTAQSVFPVSEGPLYQVQHLDFEGNQVYTKDELKKVSILEEGHLYSPEFRQLTTDNLRGLYGRKGYNDAEIGYQLERLPQQPGQLRVLFHIAEGKQTIVNRIQVTGNDETSRNFVRKQILLKRGEPLNMQALTDSRRNLYKTGAFSLVDIDRAPLSGSANQQLVNLNINVRELRPFLLSYGGYYDTERGPGGIVDIANRNSLGMARVVGMRVRYDSDLQEGRLYFSQPFLRQFPLRTTVSSYLRREIHEDFKTDRIGFSVQQEARFRKVWVFNYGYRMENTHTYESGPDPLFDTRLRVAPFTSSLSRDTRDDVLDATKGQFTSHAVDFAPTWSGSQLNFVKYFGQYFKYISLDKPKPTPMQNGAKKSRLVFATGIRIGLATGLNGQDLIVGRSSTGQVGLGERFFAGGGTTVRGFAQDGIGPRLFDGVSPAGGDAMIILNNEIRSPLYKIFDGVAFVDMGNLYDQASDFRPWQLRKAAGLGIRIRTPYFLLRFDYGIKLDRRPGEPLGRPFFSIGQAF
ncbi:translocation/assembly module TamB domain-containing protein [Bryobacter aggregatus]|uniref:translocation/assembly module TamB domain-containing protein n=1 Tax=Bryobacter aggregatus TaxID=360054 RepID=UPI0004E25F4F|nr:translocation/assembly module TamB domain-containing protein [Bryobacter aggregatus]